MPLHLTGEDAIQAEVVKQLRRAGVACFHVPNESKSSPQYRSKVKALGLSKGVPDLIIVTPPPIWPTARGAVLELKTVSGRASPEQRAWIQTFRDCGWLAEIAKGQEAALAALREWGYLK